jgi:predicted nucleic acid-binding protein
MLTPIKGQKRTDKSFVEEVVNSITHIKGLAIEPLEPEDFAQALDLMNDCKLDYEDAIHLAVATRTGAQEVVSNDKDFDATPIRRTI